MGVDSLSELRLADHMINSIYPIVDDKRVLINAVAHLANAFNQVITDFMKNNTDYAQASQLPSSTVLLDEFLAHYANKLGLSVYSRMLSDVIKFDSFIDDASIRLKKNDKLILISPEYKMVSLNLNRVKQYIIKAQEFINKVKV